MSAGAPGQRTASRRRATRERTPHLQSESGYDRWHWEETRHRRYVRSFSGEKCALAPKAAATKFPKASRCYVALGKARRVLWWLGLLLLSPALILWAEWGTNGDDDTIICRVLTFSSSSCMNLTTATEYVRRLTLVLIMGVVCWIAALVIFGVRSYMRSVYPELRDHSSSASHVLVGIISFLVLVMVFPVLVITLLSALMTL